MGKWGKEPRTGRSVQHLQINVTAWKGLCSPQAGVISLHRTWKGRGGSWSWSVTGLECYAEKSRFYFMTTADDTKPSPGLMEDKTPIISMYNDFLCSNKIRTPELLVKGMDEWMNAWVDEVVWVCDMRGVRIYLPNIKFQSPFIPLSL